VAFSKQYCLSETEARGGASCIAWASLETGAPKLSAALIFLWLLSFYQEKESNIVLLGEQKMNKTIFKTKNVTLDLRFATSRMLIVSYQDNMPKFLFT
jgi:hypothetical protein